MSLSIWPLEYKNETIPPALYTLLGGDAEFDHDRNIAVVDRFCIDAGDFLDLSLIAESEDADIPAEVKAWAAAQVAQGRSYAAISW